MKTGNFRNQVQYFQASKTALLMAVIGFICLGVSSCKKQSSENISVDSPFYQDYMVTFSATNTSAYAMFSDKNSKTKDVKLTGEQSIFVNEKSMNYADLGNPYFLFYSYSVNLDKATEVTFKFTRSKDKVFTNSIKKTDIKEISIPASLTTFDKTKTYAWTGDAISDGEKFEGYMISQSSAKTYHLALTDDKKQLKIDPMFSDVPAGKYNMYITRSKTVDTKENNTPETGKIKISYTDSKEVTVQ